MQSGFQNTWRVAAKCGFALLLFQLCGCSAHLATVKTEPARLPTGLGVQEPLDSATKYLRTAEREQLPLALGHDLLAAKISYEVLERQAKNESARSIYNFAVARVVQDVDRADLEPWRHPVTVMTDQGRYTLVSPKPVDTDHDPSRYDLFPTDTLKIGGKFFKTYSTVSGLGAPIAVVGRTESPHFRQQYKLHRIFAPITAIVRFSGRQARLEFIDPLNAERITLNKQTFPLAADFDAPTALLIARERPERLGLSRVMNPEAYADTAMLTRLQQFDPVRTPVIFVHGLQETGASWAPMIDSLRYDPAIREHYQFWLLQLSEWLSPSLRRRALPPGPQWDRARISQPQTDRPDRSQHGRNDLSINDHRCGRQNLARFFCHASKQNSAGERHTQALGGSTYF